MLFLLCPVDVLPHHAHRCTGDGLFELIVGPAALGQKSNAASRPARQLPGGHGSCPVEQAGIGFSSRAGPDHKQLPAGQPWRGKQRHALIAFASEITGLNQCGDQAACCLVEFGCGTANITGAEKKHQCVSRKAGWIGRGICLNGGRIGTGSDRCRELG